MKSLSRLNVPEAMVLHVETWYYASRHGTARRDMDKRKEEAFCQMTTSIAIHLQPSLRNEGYIGE